MSLWHPFISRFEYLCRVLGVVARCKFDMSFWVLMWYKTLSAENLKKSAVSFAVIHCLNSCQIARCSTVALSVWGVHSLWFVVIVNSGHPEVPKLFVFVGVSNFQCMEAELLTVPIPSPARWPWMLLNLVIKDETPEADTRFQLGLEKYWASTFCMYFRTKAVEYSIIHLVFARLF